MEARNVTVIPGKVVGGQATVFCFEQVLAIIHLPY